MEEDNYTPSLEDLVFFEDDALADFGDEPAKGQGVDPTELEIKEPEEAPENLEGEENQETEEELPIVEESTEDEPEETEGDDYSEDEDESEDEDLEEGSEDLDTEFTPYFNLFKEQGALMLPEDYEFDGTEEGLQKAFQDSDRYREVTAAQKIWNSLPKDFQTILEVGLSGGTDINSVREVINNQTDLDEVDIEDEDTQEEIMANYLSRTTRYSEDRIKRTINRLRSSGDLEEEAESALKELKDLFKEEREELVQQAQKQKEEEAQRLQESYSSFTEVVDSMKLPEQKRNKLINAIWSTGDYGGYKDVSYFNYIDHMVKSNPEHLAQLAELYLDYDPKQGFKSNTITKRAESKANNKLKDKLDSLGKTKSTKIGSKTRKPKAKKSDVDLLEQILNQNN
jgi:hypothetical protein